MERRLTSRNVSLDWIEDADANANNKISSHSIQNTYERLKLKYEADLRQNWAEQLESPNQILEQLSLTACLIELWKDMYGTVPDEKSQSPAPFPGFVDIACGNGILVYVLKMEGYKGSGYDACRRKSWETFPPEVQSCLHEQAIIPEPFLETLVIENIGIETHPGVFQPGTFIISDHADELTVWTPILAALASPSSPLPFFVIPCCSRSLAGSQFRYPSPNGSTVDSDHHVQKPQPCSGDLRALRAAKMREKTESGFLDSMIGSLAAKTACVAGELGCRVEKAWLRTPGAINMALVGCRIEAIGNCYPAPDPAASENLIAARLKIREVVERECLEDGGVQAAAQLWLERIKTLRHANRAQHQPN
ncbi:hypothetical protein MYU51_001141 [Penicillium brevicompactum]|uniref:uncharacterized protein n=1 Tax=Penicillium brevicompactum TaxID=5074 RepID=UPI0025409A35|nr:uncharacterized protein N7506_008950 [Penicillium brevicompactum]KAJ5325848.1 hypothetical protein N7506_008950 [Penicillium brevicompactum]